VGLPTTQSLCSLSPAARRVREKFWDHYPLLLYFYEFSHTILPTKFPSSEVFSYNKYSYTYFNSFIYSDAWDLTTTQETNRNGNFF
jgi:hypothetical protein